MSGPLEEGTVVEYEGKYWFVGLVNACRARLDPLEIGKVHEFAEGQARFGSYGDSVNVSPNSLLKVLEDPSDLPDKTFNRYLRMLGTWSKPVEKPRVASMSEFTSDEEEAARMAVASQPGARRGKNGKAKTAAKREKRTGQPCSCGCGQTTGGGYFMPGHDSKFKGALLKVEKGEVELEKSGIPKKIRDQYKWIKKGDGLIPTTNYKGEPHKGYFKG